MKWYHDWASTGTLALVLASRAGGASSAVVEASVVSNVVVTASLWDLRGEDEGGCGVAGCDPRLTRDGDDNTVVDSRWSCEPSLGGTSGVCYLSYELDESMAVSHLMIYFHESDDATKVAISFVVAAGFEQVSGVTSPGTALGAGQKVNLPADTLADTVLVTFTLTNDQWIHVSEVEIFLDVADPDDVIIPKLETLSVVNAKTVTNVVASALYWDLSSDGSCGAAGCDPRLATDGNDNTVASSRWSCKPDDDHIWRETNNFHRCVIFFHLDDPYTISHMVLYVHESDDETKSPIAFDVYTCDNGDDCTVFYSISQADGSYVTMPGTALGAGQRLNLPRPEAQGIGIHPNLTANQWIDVSEVEIFVEVAETNVPIAAAKAWTDVTAETLTPVSARASESMDGFGAALTRDGDDNTVADSHWSCNSTENAHYCSLYFDFNDEYTVSHLIMYVPDSDNATKAPANLVIEGCNAPVSASSAHDFDCDYPAAEYETKPGTPLGEGERINLIRPTASAIGIFYFHLDGATAAVSEVEMYFEVPDSSPTPAPYVASSSDTEVDAVDSDDGLSGASSTIVPGATSFDDDSAYFGLAGDDFVVDVNDDDSVLASSSSESGNGGVGASSSLESDDDGGGASSSSAPGIVSTGAGAANGPLPWAFTVIAAGIVSSMLSRAVGLLHACH